MKKTLLLIILTVLVCFTACGKDVETSSTEIADTDIEYAPAEEFDYYEENGEIVIDRYIGEAKIVKIPETIDGKPVVALDGGAFANNDIVERIILPDSLKRIGDKVFVNCWSLKKVSGGNNLESIGYMGCASNHINSMNLPDTLHTIGDSAFIFTDISELTIPPLVTEIPGGTFAATSIETLVIPSHVKSVGKQAFDSCKNLKTVVIEEGVEVLGDSVFGNCDSLTSITLPSTLTEETDIMAFWGAGSVENKCTIYVPENCVLKDAILELYNDGYDWCCAEVIPAPPGAESSLPEEETTPETEEPFAEKKEYMGYTYWEDNGEIRITGYTGSETALEIPAEIDKNPVTVIEMGAFEGNTNLISVTLPDSLEVIDNNAFWGVPITEINIPAGVTALSMGCFAETNLEHLTVPGSVKYISANALQKNEFLKTVLIEEGTERIEARIFSGCNYLKSIAIPASVTELSEDVLDSCMPNDGKLKIYVVAGSVAESVLNENYADVDCFEVVPLENMDGIEAIMEADRQEVEAAVSGQTYYVKLISAADDKVMAIKVYREFTGEGLRETKDKIDAAPCILMETASEETAKAFLEELQQLNVVVDPDIYTATINGAE